MAWDHLAIDALGLFTEEFDEGRAIGDLALGFGQRLALFGGQDHAEIMLVLHHQVEPLAHHLSAFLAGPLGPFLLRGLGLRDRPVHLGARQVRHLSHDIAAGGVRDIEGALVAIDPFAADIGAGFQQAGILEKRGEICCLIEHVYLRF